MGPSVILEDVSWQGLGNCASTPLVSSQNFQPVLRNPVDLINATYGQLLSYVVPEVNSLFFKHKNKMLNCDSAANKPQVKYSLKTKYILKFKISYL